MTKIAHVSRDFRQAQAYSWAAVTFGPSSIAKTERAARFLEEAIELCQAVGLTHGQARAIARHVYDRPPGDIDQEVGGVGVTLLALCETLGVSANDEERKELTRVLNVDTEVFRERYAAKTAAGITIQSLVSDRANAEAETY